MADKTTIDIGVQADVNKADKALKDLVEKYATVPMKVDTKELYKQIRSLSKELKNAVNLDSGKLTQLGAQFAKGGGGLNNATVLGKNLAEQILSLSKANKKFTVVSKDVVKSLNEQGKALKENGKDAEEAGKKMDVFTEILTEMSSGWRRRVAVFTSYRAISSFNNLISDAISEVVTLQKEFANVQAITAVSDSSMRSLEKTIFSVGESTRFTNEEIAKATVILGQAGFGAEQIKETLKSITMLASATGTDLSQTVSTMTSALTVWNLEGSKASEVADMMTTSINKTKAEMGTLTQGIQYAGNQFSELGVSIEDSIALFASVTNAGLKARSVIGTGSRALATELSVPSEKLKKVLEGLGLTLDDIDVKTKGITNVLQTLRDAGFGASEAFEGLDRRAATFYLAASSQLGTMRSLKRAFQELGSTEKANETQMNTLSAQWTAFKDIISEITYYALKPLTEILTKLLKSINSVLSTSLFKGGAIFLSSAAGVLTFTNTIKGLVSAYFSLRAATVGKTVATTADTIATKANTVANVANVTSVNLLSASMLKFNKVFSASLALMRAHPVITALTLVTAVVSTLIYALPSAGERLEQIQEKLDKTSETSRYLATQYEDLITKENMYKKDSVELTSKVAEVNKVLREQGMNVISLSSSWEQLTEKILEASAANERAKAKNLKDQAYAIRDEASSIIFRKFTPLKRNAAKDVFYNAVSAASSTNPTLELNKLYDSVNENKELLEKEKKALIEIINKAVEFTEKLSLKGEAIRSAEGLDSLSKSGIVGVGKYRESIAQAEKDFKKGGSIENFYKTISENVKALNEEKQKIEDELSKNPTGEHRNVLETSLINVNNTLKTASKMLDDRSQSVQEMIKAANDFASDIIYLISHGHIKGKEAEKLLKEAKSRIEEAYSESEKNIRSTQQIKPDPNKSIDDLIRSNEVARLSDLAKINDSYKKGEEAANKYDGAVQKIAGDMDMIATRQAKREAQITAKRDARSAYLEGRELSGKMGSTESLANQYDTRKMEIEEVNRLLESYEQQKEELLGQKEAIDEIVEKLAKQRGITTEILQSREYQDKLDKTEGKALSEKADVEKQILSVEQKITAQKEKQKGLNQPVKGTTGIIGGLKAWEKSKESDSAYDLAKGVDQALGTVSNKGIETFTDSFNDMVTSIREGNESIKDGFKSMAANVLKTMADFIQEMLIKAVILKSIQASLSYFGGTSVEAARPSADFVGPMPATTNFATGGKVVGGISNQDSVPMTLMPGEFVLKKSAASQLGDDFLKKLNSNPSSALSSLGGTTLIDNGEASVVNVYVVADREEAKTDPGAIIATISKDILTGGTTKKLIQSVVAGRR